MTNSISFSFPENVFIAPLFLKDILLDLGLWVYSSFSTGKMLPLPSDFHVF